MSPGRGEWFEKALFEQAEAGLEVYDTDLLVLRANPAALGMRGLPRSSVVGTPLADLDTGIPMSAVIREALGSGTVRDQHVVGYTGADPEHRHDYSVTGYRLQDGSHRIVGAAGMIHDVSVSMKNRRGLELLSTARARIGNTLDSLRTAQELAEVVFPEFADAVAVDLLESVLTGDAPLSPVRSSLPMRRAAFRAREGQYGAYPVGAASYYAFPTPYTQALADLRPRLVDPVNKAGAWLAHDPARAEYIARAGIHSLIVAPLTVHGLVMGLVSFYRDRSRPDPFDEEDLALATQLASRTALCIDNARRFTREHAIATTLQLSLLPHAPPTTSAVDSSHCYFPGRYGAHWFDVIPLACARVALVIGFVPGEGLDASATMGRLRSAAATLAGLELPPDELLVHLDDVVQRMAHERSADPRTLHQARPPLTANCVYAAYDPVTRRCAVAAAGQDGPLLTHPNGTVTEFGVPRGAPLSHGAPYEMSERELPEGTLLTFYSDSVSGRYPSEADERLSRIREAVARPVAPAEVCDTIAYTVLRKPFQDGAALLVARTHSLAPARVGSWIFPAEAQSVSDARHAARECLTRWDLDDHIPTTDLIVSELATNVIRHAQGPIRLRLILDRALSTEVSDDADTVPHLRHARLQDEGGRGLFIVASLAQHWGTRYEETGKTIWAEQDPAAG
ncbi:SpoIIE family protein phosphatase [Streptomyces sp900116325]|uniref:ATP-binding SpoIIE family protein phosphatase n=1 Tax=Streptomyces sp. 900116325 TaxID=3154295 RepID=UPI00331F9DF6